MLQLGFVSAILPELDLEGVLSTAEACRYDCVELMCWPVEKASRRYAGVTHIDVTDFNAQQADEIRKLASSYHISISALGYYPNPLSPDDAEAKQAVEHLHRVLNAAALMGLGRINTFIGRDWTKSVDDNWPRFREVWKPIIDDAERLQVRIGIENCPMLFTDDEWPGGKNLAFSPSIWRRMFEEFPSPFFGLNYDPSHLIWQQMDCARPLREFADRIFHVHAKDVRVNHEQLDQVGILAHPLQYHAPKLPGLGEVDWGRFFATLGEIGYQGPVCVEVEDRAYEESLHTRKLALTQSHDFLRNYVPRKPVE